MSARLFPRWLTVTMGLVVGALALSGFGQMPIFKRYYLADIPGMGWLAAYYVTNTIHYIGAAIFLGLLAYMVIVYLRSRAVGVRITASGALRAGAVAIIVVTGILRVLKSRPDVYLGANTVFAVDLAHLAGVMLWGFLALAAAIVRRRPYVRV